MSMTPERLFAQVRTLRRLSRLELTFDDGFRNIRTVLPKLLARGFPVLLFICSGYADRGGAPLLIPELESDDPEDLEQLRTFTWEELRDLVAQGVRVGAHTVTHPHLPELADEELKHEVEEAKERIEAELARPCPDFAYPFGEHDERVREAVRAAGYERAYSLSTAAGRLALPRLDLYQRERTPRLLAKAAKFRLSSLARVMPKEAVRSP